MSIIEVENISKKYETYSYGKGLGGILKGLIRREKKITNAVNDISFSVEQGESVAYIGPNGAGKSTTLKMLSGILEPTAGKIRVCDIDPYKKRQIHAKNIGVIFGQRSQLRWDIPAIDSLNLMSYIYNIDRTKYKKRLDLFEDILEFGSFVNKPVRQLSLGQRVRIDFAAALLHNPQILFLDEPTIGLDVIAKEKIRNFVKYVNKESKVTVILTTHDMVDIEKICNRVILIDKGIIKFDDIIRIFEKTYGTNRLIKVEFISEQDAEQFDFKQSQVSKIELNNNAATFSFDKGIPVKQLIGELNDRIEIKDFSIMDEDIESVVRRVYQQ